MEFVTPFMLLGLAGVAIPVAIHLVGRRKAKVVQFSALDFLLNTDRQVAKRWRLHNWTPLIIRCLVCVAIPLALAKPQASCAGSGLAVQPGPQAAIVLIDTGHSSHFTLGATTVLQHSKTRALELLGHLGSQAEVALATTNTRDGLAELTRDHERVRDSIHDLNATYRVGDLAAASHRAIALLRESPHRRRTLFVLSAFTQPSMAATERSWAEFTDVSIVFIDVTGGRPLPNLATTDLHVEWAPETGNRAIHVTAEFANLSSLPAVDHSVTVFINETAVARGTVTMAPDSRTRKQFHAVVDNESRHIDIAVELETDQLPADNVRHAVLAAHDETTVLVVNGDPHAVRYNDELFYLRAALGHSYTPPDSAVTRTTVDELAHSRLESVDIVILANVRALSTDQVNRLSDFVNHGGSLWITCGDNVNPDDYNAQMTPLLPQRLQTALSVHSATEPNRTIGVERIAAQHPVFNGFRKGKTGLEGADFRKIILLGPTVRTQQRVVLMHYSNGAIALVEAQKGRGKLLLFTSSIDRDWNDLAIQPGFPLLVQRTVRYLAGRQVKHAETSILVGQRANIRVGPGTNRVEVNTPNGRRKVFEQRALTGRSVLRFEDTDTPGIYRVSTKDASSRTPIPNRDFAVNIDGTVANLAKAPIPDEHVAIGAHSVAHTPHSRTVPLWQAVSLALLILLLLEPVLVLVRGR